MNRLQTARLWLRPVELGDAAAICRLAGDHDVAAATRSLPHPYPQSIAHEWLQQQRAAAERCEEFAFAVVVKPQLCLIGVVGLRVACSGERARGSERFRLGELGYWLGREYWGHGYTTEAAQAVIDYGFRQLGLHRIHASAFADNPAALRVLEKSGMHCEGRRRRHLLRFGEIKDVCLFGQLREEWLEREQRS